MIDNQTTCLFAEMIDFLLELRVAFEVNLIELILIHEVNGDLFQVIVSCTISFGRMSKQEGTFFHGEST